MKLQRPFVAIVNLGSARYGRHPELELTDAAVCIFWHYGRKAALRRGCEQTCPIAQEQTLTDASSA